VKKSGQWDLTIALWFSKGERERCNCAGGIIEITQDPSKGFFTMALPLLTIFLCTCDRAEMLREALESVRRQTARAAIARIVVSENSLCEESRSVCAEFGDLPVVYLQQRPPLAPLLHLKAIWGLAESPLVAILHDDDWWAPGHLESALEILDSNEECVAVYTSFLESFGPRSYSWLSQCYYLAWLAAGCDFSPSAVFLDPQSVMLGCLLNAGFHYSTVVGRTEAMWDACTRNVSRGNAFDNDRTFPVFLSQHGTVGYVTQPNVFVRQHALRDAWSAEHLLRGHMNIARETTCWLTANYPCEVSRAATKFNQIASGLDSASADKIWMVLYEGICEPQWSTLVSECGVELTAMRRPMDHSLLPRWANDFIKSACPPIVYRWTMKIMWERLILLRRRKHNIKKEV
jgi:glycosyltransferase involved in cell wall biosynthesis